MIFSAGTNDGRISRKLRENSVLAFHLVDVGDIYLKVADVIQKTFHALSNFSDAFEWTGHRGVGAIGIFHRGVFGVKRAPCAKVGLHLVEVSL
jgi:hypothetical protein